MISLAPPSPPVSGPATGSRTAPMPPGPVVELTPRRRPKVLMLERHAVPLVYFSWVAPAGLRHEPPGLGGLAALAARQVGWGRGDLVIGVDRDCAAFGIGALADEVSPRLEALLDAVLAPRLAPVPAPERPATEEATQRFESLRGQLLAERLHRLRHGESLAEDVLDRRLFGDAPEGRPMLGRPSTLERITGAAVQEFQRRHLSAEGSALLVTGDFDAERLGHHLDNVLPTLEGPVEEPAVADDVSSMERSSGRGPIVLVDLDEAPHAVVRMGWPAVAGHHEDFFALRALACRLAGPSTSLLTRRLRERSGAVYHVGAELPARRGPAPFSLGASLAHPRLGEALDAMDEACESLRHEPLKTAELENLRTYCSGRALCAGQTLLDHLGRLRRMVLDGADPLERELEALAGLDAETLRQLAHRHLDPARRVTVVVGQARRLRPLLAARGEVVEITAMATLDGAPWGRAAKH